MAHPATMRLSISLSNDDGKPFTPGSMILGVVKFITYEPRIVDSLCVDFRGHTSVFLNQNYGDMMVCRHDYDSKSYLFSRHQDLYNGGCVQHEGTYAWPFAFRIPLFAAPRLLPRGSKELFQQKHPWKGDTAPEPHPLPPSMTQSGRFVCSVRYVLEATLVQRAPNMSKGKKVQSSKTVSVENLDICPDILPASGSDWPYVVHRHTMHCPIRDPSRRMVHRLFPIPCIIPQRQRSKIELRFSVLLPKRLEIKDQSTSALSVPISGSVYSDTASPLPLQMEREPEPEPDLVIRCFKLSLLQHTKVRAGCHSDCSVRRIFTRKGSCRVPVRRMCRSMSESSTPATFVNLSDTVDLSVPTVLLVSDFSTYNIARFYTLEISFSLQFESKRCRFSLSDVPIRVVSQSGEELERRLIEGLETDDEYGCELAGIQWRDYRHRSSDDWGDLQVVPETGIGGWLEEDGLIPDIPPPPYTDNQ
ncbi:hypothetical protein PV05_06871 [Exophiala xenobiotica]|uniref:Arrestin-like N-terminal domain-containing protein n=1 Tax=Exophiala xenobiotica TaxID=348802 RepID=A0A0D2BPR4_9EURO|nr:uncharacterized protein PV05_06871 [Exophiala xenobiotica]KIW54516.1 hypothetical protein PV05_06871 [Exophiala xenobiotica]